MSPFRRWLDAHHIQAMALVLDAGGATASRALPLLWSVCGYPSGSVARDARGGLVEFTAHVARAAGVSTSSVDLGLPLSAPTLQALSHADGGDRLTAPAPPLALHLSVLAREHLRVPLARVATLLPPRSHALSGELASAGLPHVLLGREEGGEHRNSAAEATSAGTRDGGDAHADGGGRLTAPAPPLALHFSGDLADWAEAVLGRSVHDGRLTFGAVALHPRQVFFEDAGDSCVAFVNIRPVLPGHVLVMPRRRVPRFTDLTRVELADLWAAAQRIGRALEAHLGCTSCTYTLQDGEDAGQSVSHVHIHVIPRRAGDLRNNDDIYPMIDKTDAPPRTLDEMAAEAEVYREMLRRELA